MRSSFFRILHISYYVIEMCVTCSMADDIRFEMIDKCSTVVHVLFKLAFNIGFDGEKCSAHYFVHIFIHVNRAFSQQSMYYNAWKKGFMWAGMAHFIFYIRLT